MRDKKSGPRAAPKLFAVMLLKKELKSLPTKKIQNQKAKRVSKMAA